jgi:flagellar biosynthetic protein FliQ
MDAVVGTDYFIGVAQHAMWVLALASVPILIPALVAGLVMGMVQAATSIQEQTIAFVPKILVVGICIALFGGAIVTLLADFTREMYSRIPDLVQ